MPTRDMSLLMAVLAVGYGYTFWATGAKDQRDPTLHPQFRVRHAPRWLSVLCGSGEPTLHVPIAAGQFGGVLVGLLWPAFVYWMRTLPERAQVVATVVFFLTPIVAMLVAFGVMYVQLRRRQPRFK